MITKEPFRPCTMSPCFMLPFKRSEKTKGMYRVSLPPDRDGTTAQAVCGTRRDAEFLTRLLAIADSELLERAAMGQGDIPYPIEN